MQTTTRSVTQPLVRASYMRVHQMLPNIDQMTDEQLATVLLTYRYTIAPDFIPWLASAWGQSRSAIATMVAWNNLNWEVREDHPYMLGGFVAPLAGKYNHPDRAIATCKFLSCRLGRTWRGRQRTCR